MLKLNSADLPDLENASYFNVTLACSKKVTFKVSDYRLTNKILLNRSFLLQRAKQMERQQKSPKNKQKTKPLMSHSLLKLIKQHEN